VSVSEPRCLDGLALATTRLALRPLQDDDAPALFDIFSDPRVMRYWSSPPWSSLTSARETIAADAAAMRAGDYLRLGLELRETGELVGTCTLPLGHYSGRKSGLKAAIAALSWPVRSSSSAFFVRIPSKIFGAWAPI
jgi:hypothetical protein